MQTGNFAAYLELLYTDTLTVQRHETITNEDGTSDNVPAALQDTAKCRISYKRIDAPYELDTTGEPIVFELKVICGPAVDVRAGDYLHIIRRDGAQILDEFGGYAGQPAKYGTHQEIILIHKGRA
jgi:hypothetical protein